MNLTQMGFIRRHYSALVNMVEGVAFAKFVIDKIPAEISGGKERCEIHVRPALGVYLCTY